MATKIIGILFRSGVAAIVPLLLLAGCGDEETAPIDTNATVVAAVSATVEALTAAETKAPQPTAPTESPTPTPVPPVKVLSTVASLRPDNSLIAQIEVNLDREAHVYVEYENAEAGKFRSMTTESAATKHVVPVVRLRPTTTYSYQAFAVDSQGRLSEGVGGTFTTGELPEALATIEFDVEGRPTPELILMDYRDVTTGYILVLDQDSNIVWYYASPNATPDTVFRIQPILQKPNYNLVYTGPPTCCIREITPLGEIVDSLSYSEIDGAPHHEVIILPDNKILYLARTYRIVDETASGGDAETLYAGDSLRIWNQNTGTTHEVWNTFDALSPEVRRNPSSKPVKGLPGMPSSLLEATGWGNTANSVQIGPRGNYIVSLKMIQVLSLSPDFQSIEWSLGGPNTTFTFPDPTDRPYAFHTPNELPNGNILFFDNGQGRPEEEGGQYSRAIELALSDYDGTATKVWEYRPNPDVYARMFGSAWRLDNGNTLINFGTSQDVVTVPIMVVEVERLGREVWNLKMTGPTLKNRYRVYPHESIFGETRLR